jgi:hypothetical protein
MATYDVPPDNTLNQEKYDFNYRTFPNDIGSEGTINNHYMVININVRDKINVKAFGFEGTISGTQYSDYIKRNGSALSTFRTTNELSKTDALRFNIDPTYRSKDNQPLGIFGNVVEMAVVPRFTRRIVESIAIFMPSTLNFVNRHEYSDIRLVEEAANLIGYTPPSVGVKIAQLGQHPVNPLTEVLYKTTPQRNFIFEFLMAPSNEKESVALKQIYDVLRFHAAPEFTSISLWGPTVPFYKSPSEFDITFFKAGKENTKIPRINTCVLEQIDMDYAPTGAYATFSNGYPVSARMTLQFRELEIVSKLRVAQGF